MNKFTQVKMFVKSHKPEICGIASGILSTVAVTSMASASIKAKDICETYNDKLDNMEAYDIGEDEVRDVQKEKYTKLIKVGALPVLSLVASQALLFISVKESKNREVSLASALAVTTASLTKLRNSMDKYEVKEVMHDIHEESYPVVTETLDEDNEYEMEIKNGPFCKRPEAHSSYAVFFDELSDEWCDEPKYNVTYLNEVQDILNDKLMKRGYITLNEVYDKLGVPKIQEGDLIGWVYKKDCHESYIDFGLWNGSSPAARNFINGLEPAILIDLYPDGYIYDLINQH